MAWIVNGERIEDSAVRREIERLRPEYEKVFSDQSSEEREAQLFEWSKENVIERILLRQEVKRSEEQIPPAEVEAALGRLKEKYGDLKKLYEDFEAEDDNQVKDKIELTIRVNRKLEHFNKNLPKPSKDQIDLYYKTHQEQYRQNGYVRVAHIVKYIDWQTDEETAERNILQAKAELEKGVPFEFVVDKYTDCDDSGGDLGFISKGQTVEEFEDVVFNLEPGQISHIFRTRFGFHIAKVYEKEPSFVPELSEVKNDIINELRKQMHDKAIEEYVDDLKKRASIEIVEI
jgi:parvulin-like peptidyl-prolyl isomerase